MARQQETADSVIQYMKVPPDILDHQCTDEHLAKLSQYIHDWERIIGHLGFENARAIEAKIWRLYPRGLQQQTNAMFLEWKDLGRRNATYRRLIEVFVSLKNVTYAEKLCEIVSPPKGMDGSPAIAKPGIPPGPPPSTSNVLNNATVNVSGGSTLNVIQQRDVLSGPRQQDESVKPARKEDEVKSKDQLGGRDQPDSAQSLADGVEILLVVINERENTAVRERFQPSHKLSDNLTLGKFGEHEVAYIHTNMGDGCKYQVRKALESLQQVDKVIAIGVAGGANRGEQQLGDVLVSEWIEYGDIKVGKEATISRGERLVTPDKLRDIFCKGTEEWSGKKYLCDPEASRYSKVHAGVVLSASILWDNKDQKERLLASFKGTKFVGMEMEGKALHEVAKEVEKDERKATGVSKREIAVIVIKGVSDYGDGTKDTSDGPKDKSDGKKDKKWQRVAARAAASYTEFKLQQRKGASTASGGQ